MNAEQHYSNQRRNDLLERIAEAQERQAQAMEVLAGALLMQYTYDSDKPDFTVEALHDEAIFHGTGGDTL